MSLLNASSHNEGSPLRHRCPRAAPCPARQPPPNASVMCRRSIDALRRPGYLPARPGYILAVWREQSATSRGRDGALHWAPPRYVRLRGGHAGDALHMYVCPAACVLANAAVRRGGAGCAQGGNPTGARRSDPPTPPGRQDSTLCVWSSRELRPAPPRPVGGMAAPAALYQRQGYCTHCRHYSDYRPRRVRRRRLAARGGAGRPPRRYVG